MSADRIAQRPDHDGETYDRRLDLDRLNAQTRRVYDLMRDGVWRTLREIAEATGDPEASISARLRDLRKDKFGAFAVKRRRRGEPAAGLWEYRLDLTEPNPNEEPPMPKVEQPPTTEAETWAVVELMGHLRMAGRVAEVERFGAKLGRLDVPFPDGTFVTQLFGGQSVYRITYVSEDAARAVATQCFERPVHSWELPKQIAPPAAAPAAPAADAETDDDHYKF